jgi:hypothetical protein
MAEPPLFRQELATNAKPHKVDPKKIGARNLGEFMMWVGSLTVVSNLAARAS